MRARTVQCGVIALALLLVGSLAGAQTTRHSARSKPPAHRAAVNRSPARTSTPPIPACGDYLAFQVLLDRHGFSPGQIDGNPGSIFFRALGAFQMSRSLPASGEADCATWQALSGDESGDVLADYTIADADVDGPFTEKIPSDILQQAQLSSLGYRSPIERLGEKFHASPRLLTHLNPGVPIASGRTIRVPAVQPFDASTKPAPAPESDVTIVVSRDDSALRALAPDGTIVFFAPVTTGSVHDPLPVGDWKVTGVHWYPAFHYNPKLFWDANPNDTRATVKPGPNNPVGVVWIDLDLAHYGLHGTPEPGNIGRTESHGCVRLTNWDAARVTALVRPGTPVQFR